MLQFPHKQAADSQGKWCKWREPHSIICLKKSCIFMTVLNFAKKVFYACTAMAWQHTSRAEVIWLDSTAGDNATKEFRPWGNPLCTALLQSGSTACVHPRNSNMLALAICRTSKKCTQAQGLGWKKTRSNLYGVLHIRWSIVYCFWMIHQMLASKSSVFPALTWNRFAAINDLEGSQDFRLRSSDYFLTRVKIICNKCLPSVFQITWSLQFSRIS